MSGPSGRPGGAPGRRRTPSLAELRDERAAVDDPAIVLAAAARFLEARARSVHEVRRRLTQAGYRVDLVEGAIARLAEVGLLDDETFARAWVESRDRARPRGGRVLRLELGRKGIEAATVDEVIASRDEVGDEPHAFGARRAVRDDGRTADETGARRLLTRHAAALARVGDLRKRRQRAYGLLARNGFDPGLIGDLVRELDRDWAAEGGADDIARDAAPDTATEAFGPD